MQKLMPYTVQITAYGMTEMGGSVVMSDRSDDLWAVRIVWQALL